MAFNDDLVTLVDARIDSRNRAFRTMAACVRDSNDTGVDVIFDGATQSIPVRIFGGIRCYTDDRVAVELFGSDWVITQNYSQAMRNTWSMTKAASAGTTTSGTYVNAPGPITIDYQKHYSWSRIRFSLAITCYVTVASTTCAIGINLDSGTTNADIVRYFFNPANQHMTISGYRIIGGTAGPDYTQIPAGSYTATLIWARTAGTGVLTQDSGDWVSMEVEEIF